METVVLGADIGYSEKKRTTGVCVLRWSDTDVSWKLRRIPTETAARREALHELVGGETIAAAALDGPLRRELDEIGEYRDAELLLTRGLQLLIGKPGQASSGNGRQLNRSANEFARLILSLDVLADAIHDARIHKKALGEAFPTTFLGVMLPRDGVPHAGARSDVYFEQLLGPESPRPRPLEINLISGLLSRLLPGRRLASDLRAVVDHEDRASLTCALTAVCIVVRAYVAVGDPTNGYIVLPPRARAGEPGMQDWAWDTIQANKPEGSSAAIIVEGSPP